MPVAIGSPIRSYKLYLVRKGVQGFVIEWFNDDSKTDPRTELNGDTIRVIIGDRDNPVRVFSAVAVSNVCTFYVSAADSDFEFDLYDGLIVHVQGEDETPLADLSISVGPN